MTVASSAAGVTATADVAKTVAPAPVPAPAPAPAPKVNKLIYTPLIADDAQKAVGVNFIVANNETREFMGGFPTSELASAFAEYLNTR